jgi:hypothetical protein
LCFSKEVKRTGPSTPQVCEDESRIEGVYEIVFEVPGDVFGILLDQRLMKGW